MDSEKRKEIIYRAELYAKCACLNRDSCVWCVIISNELKKKILFRSREELEKLTESLVNCTDIEYRREISGIYFFDYSKEKSKILDRQMEYRS